MTTSPDTTAPDVDVLVVGAGITGIYQLYRAREAGFSVRLVEAGSGVGGTWFWNRYPGCRFDSESYTYGYLFSRELFDDWEWQEHFAPQPETERYLNHVVDRFDLRRHMRFDTRVTAAVFDEPSGTWMVTLEDGRAPESGEDGRAPESGEDGRAPESGEDGRAPESGEDGRAPESGTVDHQIRARYLIAATGVLSVPYLPDVAGREGFRGEAYHTGLWPSEPVDFVGKRVGVVGTSSSGVQVVATILDDVEQLTVYQRTPNWCTPLNNTPIAPAEQTQLRADFDELCQVLNTSLSGFAHPVNERAAFDDSTEQRHAFYETMWNSPGFMKLTSNYADLLFNREANAEWCEFIAGKIRSIVEDPVTAERLIPTDHLFGEKRPPFVAGYYEAFNDPKVSLVDLKETPILRVTETGIETTEGVRELDIIVWATGFDFGTGALARMGIRGRDGLALDRALGRRPDHVPRSADPRVPEPVLPRWAARRGRQQPALQRRPGRHPHRPARVRHPKGVRRHRGVGRVRGAVDPNGRQGRGAHDVRHHRPVRRLEHPGQAQALPAQHGRADEAVRDRRRCRGPWLRRLRALGGVGSRTRLRVNRSRRRPLRGRGRDTTRG